MREPEPHILIIDDDQISRELLELLFETDGYRVDTAINGNAALEQLANKAQGDLPKIILTDLRMPGQSGDELAANLRALCGTSVRLIAMSGSPLEAPLTRYDAFLLKPFSAQDLERALAGIPPDAYPSPHASPLDEGIYAKLKSSMTPKQLDELYAFCLEDALRRIDSMRQHARDGDDVTYRRQAHTIKGGCGMLGACEMAELAGTMELTGIEEGTVPGPQALLDEFLAASERLQDMLKVRSGKPFPA